MTITIGVTTWGRPDLLETMASSLSGCEEKRNKKKNDRAVDETPQLRCYRKEDFTGDELQG